MKRKAIFIITILCTMLLTGCVSNENEIETVYTPLPDFQMRECVLDANNSQLTCVGANGVPLSVMLTVDTGYIQNCDYEITNNRYLKLNCDDKSVTIEYFPVGERLINLDSGCKIALLANGEAVLTCSDGRSLILAGQGCTFTTVFERTDMIYNSEVCNGLTINYGSPAQGQTLSARLLGMYDHDAGTFGTLEIPAYDPVTQRLFLVNVLEKSIDIVNMSNPTLPVLEDRVDLSRIGEPNSIDIRHSDGTLAIAVHKERTEYEIISGIQYPIIKDEPMIGLVYFIDTSGKALAIVNAGYQPDMITFTPDGNTILVANEGQPSADYKADPEGSVTIIDVSGPLDELNQDDVKHAYFHQFESQREELAAQGIRVFGPSANLSVDFEPEYITVSPDSTMAWVAIQEANAVAELDVINGEFTRLMPLGFKPHSSGAAIHNPMIWEDSPVTDTSGLLYLGADEQQQEVYALLSDSSSEISIMRYDGINQQISVDAEPLVTLNGEGDFEDLTVCNVDDLNVFLLGDESIPSLQIFGGDGNRLARLVPENLTIAQASGNDIPILPEAIAEIESNKGFEAVACHESTAFAMTQTSLSTPGTTERWIRLLEIDLSIMELTGQYLYPVELTDGAYSAGGKMDKVTSMVAINQDELLVIERDSLTGTDASKWVFRVDTSKATNLLELESSVTEAGVLEAMSMNEINDVEVDEPVTDPSSTIVSDQIVINEVASKVTTGPPNPFQDGVTDSDYIELFNPTSTTVDLTGWKFYDDPAKSYTFPSGSSIQANSHLLLFADDTNDGNQDFAVTVDENGAHHLPIKISSGGESVTMEDSAGNVVDIVIVPALSPDTSWGRLVDSSTIFGVTALSPANPNSAYVGGEAGPTAASQGLKPVLKSPFVELGDRYGDKPEALTIVGNSISGEFQTISNTPYMLSIDDSLNSAVNDGPLTFTSLGTLLGSGEGSGLDYCAAYSAYLVADDSGSIHMIDNQGTPVDSYTSGSDYEAVTCDENGIIFAADESTTQVEILSYSTTFETHSIVSLSDLPVDIDEGQGLESLTFIPNTDRDTAWQSNELGFLVAGGQTDNDLHVYAISSDWLNKTNQQFSTTSLSTIPTQGGDISGLDYIGNQQLIIVHDSSDLIEIRDFSGQIHSIHETPDNLEDLEGVDFSIDCPNNIGTIAYIDDKSLEVFVATITTSNLCDLDNNDGPIDLLNFLVDTGSWQFNPTGELNLAIMTDSGPTETNIPMGFVNIRLHPLDASDEDAYNPKPWPVMSMYMPDGITSYTVNGVTYLITGNEGDLRDYRYFNSSSGILEIGLNEEIRIASTNLDPMRFPDSSNMQQMNQLGRLNVPNNCGDHDGDGDLDYICGVGARSFSIWTTDLQMVWDSGHDFSQYSTNNGQHLVDEMNTRDDNKGIEPEGVKVGEMDGRQYLFVSMERSFGVMIYDITDPNNPSFQQWIQVDGSSNPEDMEFVSADVSPTGTPLLLVANEDSGSVGIWELMLI